MTTSAKRLLPLLLLAAAGCASQGDAPDFALLKSADDAAAAGCVQKGIVDVDVNEIYNDVYGHRAPATRLAVAKLGGNAILILPTHATGRGRSAAVYACPAETVRQSPW